MTRMNNEALSVKKDRGLYVMTSFTKIPRNSGVCNSR